jgi:hypothetical protein
MRQMLHKKRNESLPEEVLTVLRYSPNLKPCRKFRNADIWKFMNHLNEGECQQSGHRSPLRSGLIAPYPASLSFVLRWASRARVRDQGVQLTHPTVPHMRSPVLAPNV